MTRLAIRALVLAATASCLAAQSDAIHATHARFQVAIVDSVATVDLALAVRNDGTRIGEAEWILPLPDGAVADGFRTRIGDQPEIAGEVLDAGRARAVYESIVRRRRDPGLLEFAGRGCLRARLFPIPPGEDAEVRIRWRQVLPELNGLVRWTQPVASTGIDGRQPAQVTFAVDVRSSTPIRTALSPTPGADVRTPDEHRVVASFEPAPGATLPKELALFYGLSDEAFGLHVLAQRDQADAPGYFALFVSPKRDWDAADIAPRTVTFVLDTSGSMAGAKIEQAKRALKQFLRGLRPVDRFDVVPFSTSADSFFGKPVTATLGNVDAALARVDTIEARGGTNLEAALRSGLPEPDADGAHVPICVLLSDGLPTSGLTDVGALRTLATELVAARTARVFVLGVGHDVHTLLLDDLADAGRGTRQYVQPDEDIEEKASDLLAKIGTPVLTDLELTVDGAEVSRRTPARLPDLFAGSQLVVTGRYANPGRHTVRLRGRVGDVQREYVYEALFPAADTAHDFVPKLWATRHVASLLDEIRRNGAHQELFDEVQRLGVEFQIVTPYTSHLVVEDALGVRTTSGQSAGVPVPGPGGGGGRAGPGGPAPADPSTGGPATRGPTGPSTAGPTGRRAAGHGGTYAGPGDAIPPDARERAIDVADIGKRLQDAGVLPRDARPEELEQLARQVAREMQNAARGLADLRGKASGATAVDDSVYLARLLRADTGSDRFYMGTGRTPAAGPPLWELFVRRVGDKVFQLREGVWTDRAFDATHEYASRVRVVAFSDEYFALLRELPVLARYVALSDRMRIVVDDRLIEISRSTETKDGATRKP